MLGGKIHVFDSVAFHILTITFNWMIERFYTTGEWTTNCSILYYTGEWTPLPETSSIDAILKFSTTFY